MTQGDGHLNRIMALRAQETTELANLANSGRRLAEAARWFLEEGTDESRENLAGAVAAWEVEA